jgi:acetyl-CoA synthetase
MPRAAREVMLARGTCPLQGLDAALSALAACARLGERLAAGKPPSYPAVGDRPRDAAPIDERAAKELLAAYGVAVPSGRLVAADEVASAARDLGFPVAVKLASAELSHKAAAGAVALSLRDPDEVAAAVRDMLSRNRDLRLDGLLVERMVEGAVAELLVGVRHDPSFGHVLLVGSGGSLVELVADTAPLLLPVGRDDVKAALASLRVWPRLALGDVEAAVAAVLAVARLVEERGEDVAELEVNPLLVLERGAVAVDALCLLRR